MCWSECSAEVRRAVRNNRARKASQGTKGRRFPFLDAAMLATQRRLANNLSIALQRHGGFIAAARSPNSHALNSSLSQSQHRPLTQNI